MERETSSNSLDSTNSYAALCWARDLDRHIFATPAQFLYTHLASVSEKMSVKES